MSKSCEKNILIYLSLFILSLIPVFSCGYHFQSRTISINEVRSFSEISVKNETYEPELDLIVKGHLTARFSANRWLKEKDKSGSAKFLCTVTKYENSAVSHSADDSISQYEVALTFSVSVYTTDMPENIIYSISDRRYVEQYSVDTDVKVTLQNKKAAINRISDKFAHDVEDSISQGF